MKTPKTYILSAAYLAIILGAVPAILLAAKPLNFPFIIFKFSSAGNLLFSSVWILWIIVAGVFLLELSAMLRGRLIPLFLPVIQRPMSKAISNFFIPGSIESAVESKPGLLAARSSKIAESPQAAHSRQMLAVVGQMLPGSSQPSILQVKKPGASRQRIAKITAYALALEDAKLRSAKLPQILGICLEADAAKVILLESAELPEGFLPNEDRDMWEISFAQIDSLPEVKSTDSVMQLMVLMGYYKGSNSFYLNLEVASQLVVYGDHDEVLDFLSEKVASLINDAFYAGLKIFCVGFGYEIIQNGQIMAVDRLSDILSAIEKQSVKLEQMSTGASAYKRENSPVLVIDPFTDKRELTDGLAALAGNGISVILGYGACRWALEIDTNQVSLSPLGLVFSRTPGQDLQTPDVYEEATNENKEQAVVKQSMPDDIQIDIIRKAEDDRAEEDNAEDDVQTRNHDGHDGNAATYKSQPENPSVEILGAVRIKNPLEAFTSMQSVSLVCFLAVNRNGVSSDYLMRWLWHPDEPPTRQILANVVSRARRCLGSSQDGQSYISYEGGIYRLDERVIADFEIFRQNLKKSGETKNESERLKFLTNALSMVKGVPFLVGSSRAFRWADNGFRSELEFEIDTAVHQLVELAVKRDDFDLARSAIGKGLECIPGCEQCMARLLALNARTKNCGALIKAKEDMLAAYSSLGYEVPESLLDLFSELYEGIKNAGGTARVI